MSKLDNITDEQFAQYVAQSTSWHSLALKTLLKGGGANTVLKKRVDDLKLDTSHFTGQAWSKGKTKDVDPRLSKQGQTYSERVRTGKITHPFRGKSLTKEHRQKIALSAHGSSNGLIRTKWFEVFCPLINQNARVQGKWEKAYAEYLNINSILWLKSKTFRFNWTRGGGDINHVYHPDFYLPASDEYVEIKGFFWRDEKRGIDDRLKLQLVQEQNPTLKLRIIMKKEMEELGLL